MSFRFIIFISLIGALLNSACTSALKNPVATSDLFYVTSVTPSANSVLSTLEKISLTFSAKVLPASLSDAAVFLLKKSDYEKYSSDDWKDLRDDVTDHSVPTVNALVQLVSDTVVDLTVTETLENNETYTLVVIPLLQSEQYIPLNQSNTGAQTQPFVAEFLYSVPVAAAVSAAESTSEAQTEDSSQESETSESAESTTVATVDFDWSRVLITEIITDPQTDWSDSSGGNSVAYDAIAGSGTISDTDELIEIYNGTNQVIDFSQWSLTMSDGSDVSELLSDTSWTTYTSNHNELSAVAPQEFLVLGNPSGALNNEITVSLYDDEGAEIDAVTVTDGNASGQTDEAYALDADGLWQKSQATPGSF